MTRRTVGLVLTLAVGLLAGWLAADAQPAGKPFRVGVVLQGGPYYAAVDGLRDGLRALGLEEGKHFVLDIRDAKGDLRAVEDAARTFEREKADLIFAVGTSVTLAVKRATAHVPVVFYAGNDPVVNGLVESFANPGGRLTGVHSQNTDLIPKRLEILKETLPKLRRVVTFYDPGNRLAVASVAAAREAGRVLGVEVIARPVTSVDQLRAGLRALKAGDADAYFVVSDGMVISQAQLIIDTARSKRLPVMANDRDLVAKGALASYGGGYHEAGRQSAKHVQRILAGTNPKDLPIENVDRIELVLNLRTAQELGLTIPQSVLFRANEVIR